MRLNIGFLWSWLAANADNAAPLPVSKLALINKAAIAACDAADGVKDGIIGDPLSCKFDPVMLQCGGADGADCLTKSQVAAVRAIYDGAKNPRTGERLYSGWVRGSEAGWSGYFVGQREPARLDFWRYWVFHDPNWDFRSFDFDRDAAYADSKMEFLTANNPDLSRFSDRGGKLLLYQGWADPVVPPEDTIRYYEKRAAFDGRGKRVDRGPPLSCSRHGALLRRARPQHVRRTRRAGRVGDTGNGAVEDRRDAHHERSRRPQPPVMSVSPGSALERLGKYRRCFQLRVRRPADSGLRC